VGGEGYTESLYCVSVERGAMGVEKKWRSEENVQIVA